MNEGGCPFTAMAANWHTCLVERTAGIPGDNYHQLPGTADETKFWLKYYISAERFLYVALLLLWMRLGTRWWNRPRQNCWKWTSGGTVSHSWSTKEDKQAAIVSINILSYDDPYDPRLSEEWSIIDDDEKHTCFDCLWTVYCPSSCWSVIFDISDLFKLHVPRLIS